MGIHREGLGRICQVSWNQPGSASSSSDTGLTPDSSMPTPGALPSSRGPVDHACSLLTTSLQRSEASRHILRAFLLATPNLFCGVVSVPFLGLASACKLPRGSGNHLPYFGPYRPINLVQAPSLLLMAIPPSGMTQILKPLSHILLSGFTFHLDTVLPQDFQVSPRTLLMLPSHKSHGFSLLAALGPISCCQTNKCGLGQQFFLLRTLVPRLSLLVTGSEWSTVQIRGNQLFLLLCSCPSQTLSIPSSLQGSPACLKLGFSACLCLSQCRTRLPTPSGLPSIHGPPPRQLLFCTEKPRSQGVCSQQACKAS